MTNTERREKLAEIFGQQAEYFEEFFSPDDFDERDAAVAKKIGKPLSELKFGDVFDYINKEKPELRKEFMWCIIIAKDAQKHGRVWTEDNPLKTLVSRKDISILEEFTMYEILCASLGLREMPEAVSSYRGCKDFDRDDYNCLDCVNPETKSCFR